MENNNDSSKKKSKNIKEKLVDLFINLKLRDND